MSDLLKNNMDSSLLEEEKKIRNKIGTALSRYRKIKLFEGILASLSFFIITVLIFSTLDWFIQFPRIKREWILLIEISLSFLTLILLGIYPAIRGLSDKESALLIERTFPMENRLISTIQLMENKFDDSTSKLMQELNLLETGKILSGLDVTQAIPMKRIHNFLKFLGTVSIFLLLLIIIFPNPANTLSQRMLLKEYQSLKTGKISIQILPGHTKVRKGDNLRITAKILGYKPINVSLITIGKENQEPLKLSPVSREKGLFEIQLSSLEETFYYQIHFDHLTSKGPFLVEVLHPPLITAMETEIHSPEYTMIPVQSIAGEFDAVSVIEYSRLDLKIFSNKNLQTVTLNISGLTDEIITYPMISLSTESSVYEKTLTIEKSCRLKIQIKDQENLTAETSQSMRIHCIEDKKPLIELLSPGRDIELAEDSIVPLTFRSRDDFGLKSLNLYFTYQDQPLIKLPFYQAESQKEMKTDILGDHPWDLSFYPLGPDDILIYFIEAEDNCAPKGFQKTRTPTYSIRVPSIYEYFQDIAEEEEEQAKELEKILQAEQEILKQAKQIERKIQKNEQLNWDDRKKIENLENEQKKIMEQSEKLQQKFQETLNKMQKNPLFDQATMQKVQEMQKLLDEVIDKEMMQTIKELQQAKNQIAVSQQEMKKMMESISEKEFKNKLDRMIDLLRKVKQEQTLKAAVSMLKKTIEAQKKISEELEKLKNKESLDAKDMQKMKKLSLEEKSMEKTLNQVKEDLEKLAQDMGDKEESLKEMLEKAIEKMDKNKTLDKMKDAEKQMSMQNPSEAQLNVQESIPELQDMEESLSMALSSMQGDTKKQLDGLIKKAISLGLRISEKQEEMNLLIPGKRPLFEDRSLYPVSETHLDLMGGQQLEINEAHTELTRLVVELSSSTFLISPQTVSLCSMIQKRLEASSNALGEKNPNLALKHSEESVSIINMLLSQLLDTMENLNQSSGSGMGFEQMMENLKKMTQQQGKMNQMTQQMMQQMSQDGQLSEFQQEMLKQMQAQQNMMRQAMEEMAKNSSIDQQLSKKLQQISQEMKDSDKLYENRNLERLQEKQRKIQDRMLDAQKSLHKEKQSKKRLAKTAEEKDFKRGQTPPSLKEFEKVRKNSELTGENRKNAIPSYENITREYFHKLSTMGGNQ